MAFAATVNLASIPAGQGSTVLGRIAGDRIGLSVANLGDVDGDGRADWGVAGRHALETTPTTQFSAYVLLSSLGWPTTLDLAAQPAFRIADLPTGSQQATISIAGAGDMNGDGFADVIVGSVAADANGRTNSGGALVYYGSPGGPSYGFRIDGAFAGDEAGSTVAGVGDVNGDGFADVAVTAQGFFAAWPTGQAASTHVVLGQAGPRGDVDLRSPGAAVWRIDHPSAELQRPIVSAAGDMNGDGLADLAVAQFQGETPATSFASAISVVFGRAGAGGVTQLGAPGTGGFQIIGGTFRPTPSYDPADIASISILGRDSMAPIGDINGDGLGDLLIGATLDYAWTRVSLNMAYVVFGGQPDGAVVDLRNLGSAGFPIAAGHWTGMPASGAVVSSAGDVNGDGRPDFLVGAVNIGSVWLFLGRDGPWSTINQSDAADRVTLFTEGALGNGFGSALAGGGDANGDGFADILLASPLADSAGRTDSGAAQLLFSGSTGGALQRGTTLADTLRGGGSADTLLGGGQNDKLFGAGGDDALSGGHWDDQLFGEDGADMLNGNAGHDMLAGGWGNDTLYGEDENDALFGEGGDDTLIMGFGDDRGYGQDGDDLLFGEGGQDLLVAGWGNDTAYGQAGQDQLFGEGGNDSLFGGDADDRVYGQAGDDRAWGEAGNDLVNGGDGLDSLWGGAGADIFFFDRPHGGTDMVMDFNRAEGDRIQVAAAQFAAPVGFQLTAGVGFHSGLDARPTAATATFYQDTRSQALWFDADGIGPGGAHVVAFLIGNPTLTASDIVFV